MHRLLLAATTAALALLFAAYAPMFFFEAMLLPPVLVVFLNLAFFLALLRCVERARWWRGLSTGVLLGASAATVSIVLPFAAVVGDPGQVTICADDDLGIVEQRPGRRAEPGGTIVTDADYGKPAVGHQVSSPTSSALRAAAAIALPPRRPCSVTNGSLLPARARFDSAAPTKPTGNPSMAAGCLTPGS